MVNVYRVEAFCTIPGAGGALETTPYWREVITPEVLYRQYDAQITAISYAYCLRAHTRVRGPYGDTEFPPSEALFMRWCTSGVDDHQSPGNISQENIT